MAKSPRQHEGHVRHPSLRSEHQGKRCPSLVNRQGGGAGGDKGRGLDQPGWSRGLGHRVQRRDQGSDPYRACVGDGPGAPSSEPEGGSSGVNGPVTARIVQGMAPYAGQARCLGLGFWPECFRRLNVKGGRRSFPEETRSALDIEGKHVTIEGPSPDLMPTTWVRAAPVPCGSSAPASRPY